MTVKTICECDRCGLAVEELWPFALADGWESVGDEINCPDCMAELRAEAERDEARASLAAWTYVEDIEESHAPPTKPLLRLSVVGNGRLLSVAIVEPDPSRDMAYIEKAEVIVPLDAAVRHVNAAAWDAHRRLEEPLPTRDDAIEEVGRLTLALGKAEAERDEARAERDEWNERADLNAGELAHAERLRDEARAETRRVRKRLDDENRKAVARTKAQRARADGYGEALERIAKAHATAAHLQSIARTALNETQERGILLQQADALAIESDETQEQER